MPARLVVVSEKLLSVSWPAMAELAADLADDSSWPCGATIAARAPSRAAPFRFCHLS